MLRLMVKVIGFLDHTIFTGFFPVHGCMICRDVHAFHGMSLLGIYI